MILLLGGTGYMGSAIRSFFDHFDVPYQAPTRDEFDHCNPFELFHLVDTVQPDFLINAIGYVGKPNVSAAEHEKYECYRTNVVLPNTIRYVCDNVGTRWANVSSGCIFDGYETDYDEDFAPNFCFENNNSSWYSGTMAHGELAAGDYCYNLRLRIPFSMISSPRNLIDKLLGFERVVNVKNSMTWVEEFCWNLLPFIYGRPAYGAYNMVNPDPVLPSTIIHYANKEFADHHPEFISLEDFKLQEPVPRSNCVLSNEKSRQVGCVWTATEMAMLRCLHRRASDGPINWAAMGYTKKLFKEMVALFKERK